MMPRSRIDLRIAAAVCGVIGLYDVLYVLFILSDGPIIGPVLDVPFADFLVFHAAARAYFEGKTALVYHIDAFTQFHNSLYGDRFPEAVSFRPFLYPPTWLLLLLPLGLIGAAKAYGILMTTTVASATALDGRYDHWGWLAVVTSPAAVWTVLAGQNTFLSMALFYGGLRLLERSPIAAGVLLGLLSYKPQIWVLVPLALLAARQWRALAWMMGTVAGLALVSLAVFGLDLWLAFLDATREASSPRVAGEMFDIVFMHMTTLFAAVRMLGLPLSLAATIQLASAALTSAAVWLAFRRHSSSAARTAVLITATFLVSPYILNYDLLLLMPAVVALFRHGATDGFYPLERLTHLALWVMPTFGMLLNRFDLPIMPLIILLFGVIAWAHLRAESKVELPSPGTAG